MTPLDEWSARRRYLYLTTQNTTDRHPCLPVEFETRSLSSPAAAKLRLRLRSHWELWKVYRWRDYSASLLLLVRKKADVAGEAKWPVVVAFRKLNEWTVGDTYPLPNISDIIDQLTTAKHFSTISLAATFSHIRLAERVRPKSAVSTSRGHFEVILFCAGHPAVLYNRQTVINTWVFSKTQKYFINSTYRRPVTVIRPPLHKMYNMLHVVHINFMSYRTA